MDQDEPTWWERLVTTNPALIRGLIVSFFGLIAGVLGVTIADDTVQNVITVVLGLLGLLAAILIKPSVTPNGKVVVRDDTPLDETPTIQPGEVIVAPQFMHAVEKAARVSGKQNEEAA